MKYLWCITKDWKKPADGEKWHKAKSEETAATAGVRYIRKNTHHYVGGCRRSAYNRHHIRQPPRALHAVHSQDAQQPGLRIRGRAAFSNRLFGGAP